MYEKLIPIEIDTIGIESIHTYKHIWVYKKSQNWYQLKKKISMIPIETTIMNKCIHHITNPPNHVQV